jgi:hypothetical protein
MESEAPGDCSPSRNVVSNITTFSADIVLSPNFGPAGTDGHTQGGIFAILRKKRGFRKLFVCEGLLRLNGAVTGC